MSSCTNSRRWGLLAAGALLLGHACAAESIVRALRWSNTSAGPDGPWNVLEQAVDFPSQYQRMFPSLTQTTVFINASNCDAHSDSCPLPVTGMWTGSGAQNTIKSANSAVFDITSKSWDNLTGIVGMKGSGHYIFDRVQICSDCFMDGNAVLSADDLTISFPGGAQYRPDVGYLSMFANTNTYAYQNTTGQRQVANRTLYTAFANKFIPSLSYGLHIGSVYPNITPSLYWGGYDSARLLGPAITSNNDSFTLRDISLTVSSGGGAYLNNTSNSTISVLSAVSGQTLVAKPDPGPPYLYLPQAVCDAIAKHIPVSWNKAFNLYTWNTDDAAYKSILSSPHSLTFSFSSAVGSGSTNINVPFALLNLTLDYPLASPSIQYFPCSPYEPSSGAPYVLGRAFLQAAFIGHAWNQKKLFLAQAPGPAVQAAQITTIGTNDVALANYQRTPTWEQSWALTLQALPGTFNNTGPDTGNGDSNSGANKKSGLSSGAIAGIVVGVVVPILILLVAFFIWRRLKGKKERRPVGGVTPGSEANYQQAPVELGGTARVEKDAGPVMTDVRRDAKKYTTADGPPAELPASSPIGR